MNIRNLFKTRSSKGAEPNSAQGVDSYYGGLFGAIGKGQSSFGTGMDFIPQDGSGNLLDFKGGDNPPQWLGLASPRMQKMAYTVCSPLSTVIDKIAQAGTNGRLGFINEEDGSPKENWRKNPKLVRIMRLLKNPNPIQTWEEFNSQQDVIAKIYGYCPVFAIKPVGFDASYTSSLWNLDPEKVTPVKNYNFDIYDRNNTDKKNLIKEWTGNFYGTFFKIQAEDVLIIKDGYVSNLDIGLDLPMSKVEGLDFAISNICAAMEADNVLLKKKGPLGVFSYDAKPDMAGSQPMKNEDKNALQNDLKRYGLGVNQLQYIISKSPMKWNPMSFNVAELMTKETFRQGVDSICDRFSYPAELMSGKNATYENRSSAERYLYQNNIIPFSLRKTARYNEFFELEETLLTLSYLHVAALQEDITKSAQSSKFLSESLDLDWKAGIITFNEYRAAKDLTKQTNMDIYYPEWLETYGKIITDGNKENKPKDTGNTKKGKAD